MLKSKLNKKKTIGIINWINNPTNHQYELVDFAQKYASKYFDINLDLSTESINDIEMICKNIHDKIYLYDVKSEIYIIAIAFAAYIITTLEENTEKGEWGTFLTY